MNVCYETVRLNLFLFEKYPVNRYFEIFVKNSIFTKCSRYNSTAKCFFNQECIQEFFTASVDVAIVAMQCKHNNIQSL